MSIKIGFKIIAPSKENVKLHLCRSPWRVRRPCNWGFSFDFIAFNLNLSMCVHLIWCPVLFTGIIQPNHKYSDRCTFMLLRSDIYGFQGFRQTSLSQLQRWRFTTRTALFVWALEICVMIQFRRYGWKFNEGPVRKQGTASFFTRVIVSPKQLRQSAGVKGIRADVIPMQHFNAKFIFR